MNSNTLKIDNSLRPELDFRYHLNIYMPNTYKNNENPECSITRDVSTLSISPKLQLTASASSLMAEGKYIQGDANVVNQRITMLNETRDGNIIYTTGLNPDQGYKVKYEIDVKTKDGNVYSYCDDNYYYTNKLSMASLPPKVVKDGNVIVAATTNLDDNEKNVGFEWRRTDWPDDFPSNTGSAVIYKGQIEGYIRNVNANYLWRVRPYYLSNSGTYHYGDWIGMDPGNTSYFDPTVHTYDKIEVKGNTALLKGYALNGTDKVSVQGFKYWKSTASVKERDVAPLHASAVPSDALTVEASGQVMTASLSDLTYSTTYNYVAFVTTSEGDTFYGEIESFTTEEDPDARLKGDVNEDGKVDISDIVAVINQIAGTSSYKYADVNNDGKTDISDIVAIINEIAGQ